MGFDKSAAAAAAAAGDGVVGVGPAAAVLVSRVPRQYHHHYVRSDQL